MTKDNFDYFTDEDFEYTKVLNFYTPFENKKGKNFVLIVTAKEFLDEYWIDGFKNFAKQWTWGEDRRIKAFKLLEAEVRDNVLTFTFETIRKSKRYDEIKYFLYDIGGILSIEENEITNIVVQEK